MKKLCWVLSVKWMSIHWRAAPWILHGLSRVTWYKSCCLWNVEESSDSQQVKELVLVWIYCKLLLIWARSSDNNYECLYKKPDVSQQLTATLNHSIWLKLECLLSDKPLLWLTSLAVWTCCLKRQKAQNLTLTVVNYLHIPPKGLICSTLAMGWKPDSHSCHVRKPLEACAQCSVVSECIKCPGNACFACFQSSPGGQRAPTHTWPCPSQQ